MVNNPLLIITLLGKVNSFQKTKNEWKSFDKSTLQCSFEVITFQTFVVEYKLQYEALIVFRRIGRWSQLKLCFSLLARRGIHLE